MFDEVNTLTCTNYRYLGLSVHQIIRLMYQLYFSIHGSGWRKRYRAVGWTKHNSSSFKVESLSSWECDAYKQSCNFVYSLLSLLQHPCLKEEDVERYESITLLTYLLTVHLAAFLTVSLVAAKRNQIHSTSRLHISQLTISVLYSFVCCLFCRKLTPYDDWNHIVIHVAMDNTVVINDISECGFPPIRHVNIKVILLCIGTSKWTLYTYATQLNSDWLFIAQSRVL